MTGPTQRVATSPGAEQGQHTGERGCNQCLPELGAVQPVLHVCQDARIHGDRGQNADRELGEQPRWVPRVPRACEPDSASGGSLRTSASALPI